MSDKNNQEKYQHHLESYKVLIDWHKWTYDTYHKEYRLLLGIEVLLLGVIAKGIIEGSISDITNLIILYSGILLGLLLAIFWAGRQRRQLYLSKAKIEELKKLEKELPNSFRYFSEVYEESKTYLRTKGNVRIPLLGSKLRVIPNPYAKQSFTHSVIVQQLFMLVWLLMTIALTVRIFVYT